jgi:hypothetical protein
MLAVAGLPAVVRAAGKPFWEERDPKDWTPAEVEEMLNRSPWAAAAHISFFAGGGEAVGLPRPDPFGNNRSPRVNGRGGAKGTAPTDSNPGSFHAVARWESARPVWSAARSRNDDAGRFYIVALIGDLPDLGGAGDDDAAARTQRSVMMRESTRLERKGESPIYLDHVEPGKGGDFFYFSRLEPIKAGNKEITFTTRMGPLEIKAKFSLKEMMYRGKLEL